MSTCTSFRITSPRLSLRYPYVINPSLTTWQSVTKWCNSRAMLESISSLVSVSVNQSFRNTARTVYKSTVYCSTFIVQLILITVPGITKWILRLTGTKCTQGSSIPSVTIYSWRTFKAECRVDTTIRDRVFTTTVLSKKCRTWDCF